VVSDKLTDQALVDRVKKGDKKAFDELVRKYQKKVANLVARYIRDQAEVLDVTQEAFIKAYNALPNFRGESAFYTWLYRVAINTAKNHIAAAARRPPREDVEAEVAEQSEIGFRLKEQDTPENLAMLDELARVLKDALEGLPEDLKAAISLREFEGLSYEEIAEVMDCPVGTVRSRIFRAREALDKKLNPLLRQ
tara:strand:- start:5402 stop:5983 length:582 start_codon:yes stop_codon:yes gene_type:complete